MSSPSPLEIITANYKKVRERITQAALRVQRQPHEIKLIAVTKYASLSAVKNLLSFEHVDLGENRPQQLLERSSMFSNPSPRWHFIGNLQRNKVQQVLPVASLIHAVDSIKLLERINFIAQQMKMIPEVLLEINISEEETKHGFSVDEFTRLAPLMKEYSQLKICGLMTMAPFTEPENTREVFRKLRELRDKNQPILAPHPMNELSMGMSNDFEIAIEEGATMVRIGSSIFEGLPEDE